jgi:hypothetical protein
MCCPSFLSMICEVYILSVFTICVNVIFGAYTCSFLSERIVILTIGLRSVDSYFFRIEISHMYALWIDPGSSRICFPGEHTGELQIRGHHKCHHYRLGTPLTPGWGEVTETERLRKRLTPTAGFEPGTSWPPARDPSLYTTAAPRQRLSTANLAELIC